MNKKFWALKIAGFIVCAVAFAALLGWVVMTLWNGVLTTVVNVPIIGFWQALGILVLSKILFGGFGSKSWGGGRGRYWTKEMREKWQHMTPEEREKLKQEWRNRCRTWRRGGEQTTGAE
jgi:hypothetical protein